MVKLDTGGAPGVGAIYIEPPAKRRGAVEAARAAGVQVHILDPQHGGSRGIPPNLGWNADRWPDGWCDRPTTSGMALPVAACTAALEVMGQCEGQGHQLIILQPTAGLDDYLAAAVLSHPGLEMLGLESEEVQRLCAVARADNAAEYLEPWRPGQRLRTVADSYPGLSRLVCCGAISVGRRVELVGEWLATGGLTPTYREMEAVCGWHGDAATIEVVDGGRSLEEIDRTARADLDTGAQAAVCEVSPDGLVVLVRSNLVGLSAGRAAFTEGYARAPVAICWSQPDPAQPARVTIGRAPNATHLVTLDFGGLRAALDAAEVEAGGAPGWGGNPTTCVMGSPKPGGTRCDPGAVVARVLASLTRAES